jgi:hypothetical protein
LYKKKIKTYINFISHQLIQNKKFSTQKFITKQALGDVEGEGFGSPQGLILEGEYEILILQS